MILKLKQTTQSNAQHHLMDIEISANSYATGTFVSLNNRCQSGLVQILLVYPLFFISFFSARKCFINMQFNY